MPVKAEHCRVLSSQNGRVFTRHARLLLANLFHARRPLGRADWLPVFGRAEWLPFSGRAEWLPVFGCAEWLPVFGRAEWLPVFGCAEWLPVFGCAEWLPVSGRAEWLPVFGTPFRCLHTLQHAFSACVLGASTRPGWNASASDVHEPSAFVQKQRLVSDL
eukprot:360923-Chlamydomonas_euryale.AAC.1